MPIYEKASGLKPTLRLGRYHRPVYKCGVEANTNAPAGPSLYLDPSASLPRIYVPHATRHPNIFRRRIARIEGRPGPGDWVAVYADPAAASVGPRSARVPDAADASDGPPAAPRLFAYGLYNPKSEIAVRLLRWGDALPDAAYWQDRLRRAVALRHELLELPSGTDAYRLIHGEADGFPGVVVDRYGDVLSAEVFSLGMLQRSIQLLRLLCEVTGLPHYRIRVAPGFSSQEGFEADSVASEASPAYVTVTENGTRYRIQFDGSHKTGFFCDQRDNRRQLAQWSSGRRVLDLCCYTGGFSVQAAASGGAAEVTGVDIDEQPLAVAKKNAHLNQVRVRFAQADVFAFMRDMLALGRNYDIVVLDPPKLIRSRRELEEGVRKHHDLNKLAMQLVAPGGLMLSCSCAGLLDQAGFDAMLHAAARGARPPAAQGQPPGPPRMMQIVRRVGAAADHPVAVHCPETEYFRSVWLRLE